MFQNSNAFINVSTNL